MGHRVWGWIGREFGAPVPDADDPREMVPVLESAPIPQVQVLAAQLVTNDVAAFVSRCGPMGQVIVPWPTDVLNSNLRLPNEIRRRANLYVFRAQLAQAQAVIESSPHNDVEPDQVP